MTTHTMNMIQGILMVVGGVFALYTLYSGVVALFGFRRRKALPNRAPKTRFALFVAARNEEAVIGNLVDSLHGQNYPKELFDVFVAPNNCTDNTREEALAHGARVYDPSGTITSKGDVMRQFVDWAMADGAYDAICVFDADNLVDKNFLARMNDAHEAGYAVAQGFRDSKNPADSAISTCYSVCYWMLSRFYNGGREAIGLSGLVNGSGFMVDMNLLRKLGGWHTTTMTEDYEFSAQCMMAGEKVHYVPEAVIYDEQPLTFMQSWRQRRRWSTGSIQGMNSYVGALLKTAMKERSWACFDLALTFLMPAVQFMSLFTGLATVALLALKWLSAFGAVHALQMLLLAAAGAAMAVFFACALLVAWMVWHNRGVLRGTSPGIAYFSFFLLSWALIYVVSMFFPKKSWDAIAHTRALSVKDMGKTG